MGTVKYLFLQYRSAVEEIGRETLQKELHVNRGVQVRDDEKPKELQYLKAWKTYPGKNKRR